MDNTNHNEKVLKLKPVLIESILIYLTIQEIKDIMSKLKNEKMSKSSLNSLK